MTVSENFSRDFSFDGNSNVQFQDVQVEDNFNDPKDVTVISALSDGTFLDVVLEGNFENGDTVTATYEVTLPGDAPQGADFVFNGTAGIDDQDPDAEVAGDDTITTQQSSYFYVKDISPTNAEVEQGEIVNATASIENTGHNDSESQSIGFTLQGPNGTVQTSSEQVTLDAGQETNVSVEIDTSNLDPALYQFKFSSDQDAGDTQLTVQEAPTPTGPLSIDADPGEVGVENNYTYAFNASQIDDGTDVQALLIDFDNASGVDTTAIEPNNISVVGDNVGNPGVDATSQEADGVVRLTMADTFTLGSEDGNISVNISDVGVQQSGDFDGSIDFLNDADETIANGTSAYTINQATTPPNFQLSNLTPADATVTQGDDPINISADVTNTGEETGTQDVWLTITNETGDVVVDRTQSVQLQGGENQTVVFTNLTAGEAEAGNYTHTVTTANDTIEGSLTVEQPFDFGVEIQQDATVEQGATTDISVYPNNRAEQPVTNTTVELLVDANNDSQFTADEVVASRPADFAGGEYRQINLTYENVQLDPGQYSYMGQISKDGQTTRSFTNGTLTVEAATDPAPANFQLSNLDPSNATVNEGDDPINISVDVENTGDETGTQEVQLEITDDENGTVAFSDSQTVELQGGETQTVAFEGVSPDELGTGNYTHVVSSENDSVAGSLTVEEDPFSQGDGAGFGSVIALIAILATALVARRRM